MSRLKALIFEEEKSIAKAAFYYLVCQFLVRGMMFLTTPLFTRMMSKTQYGEVASFFAWEALLYPVLTLNMADSIGKSVFKYEKNYDQFILSVLSAGNFFTLACLVLFLISGDYFERIFGMDRVHITILCVYIIFLAAFQLQQLQYHVFFRYKFYVIYTILLAVIRLLLSFFLVSICENKSDARIAGYIVPTILLGFFIWKHIWKLGKRPVWNQITYAAGISLPLLVAAMSAAVLGQSDRIVITMYCGEEQTALYSVAYAVSSIASVIGVAMNQAWKPWLRESFNNKRFNVVRRYCGVYALLYCAGIVFLMLTAPEIVLIMGGAEYREAIWAMPAVILSMVINFLYSFYYEAEYFYDGIPYISLGTCIAAVLNMILNLVFVPEYGFVAASYSTLASNFFILCFNYLAVKYRLGKGFLFDNRKFGGMFCILCVLQIILAFFYPDYLIRYALFLFYTVLLVFAGVKNKDVIKRILSELK